MATVVDIQVQQLDLDDDATLACLERFDNATFGKASGVPIMTVYVEDGQAVVATVVQAARTLANKVPGANAVRVHLDLVCVSDIADRVGVSREAVRKWTSAVHTPFPQPLDVVGQDMRVWRWVDVVAWLLDAKGIDMDEDLPSGGDIAHIDACLAKVPDHTSQTWFTLSVQQAHLPDVVVGHARRPVTQPSVVPRVRKLAQLV